MRVRIAYRSPDLTIDETIEGASAEALMRTVQERVAERAGFLLSIAIRAMSPTQFAQEVTRRYNESTGACVPIPATCEQFLQQAVQAGIATIVEE